MTIKEFKFHDVAQLHYMQALDAYLEKDYSSALKWMEHSLKMMADIDGPFTMALSELAMAHINCELGNVYEAGIHIQKAASLIESSNNDLLGLYLLLAQADLSLAQGDRASLRAYLHKTLTTADKLSSYNHSYWHNSVMRRICGKAIEMNVGINIARRLLKFNNQILQSNQPILAESSKTICIFSLGRFSLVVDGKPTQSITKAQKKPLELLKAIIAYGGREVSEESICDALWPDKEGDLTHRNCATTLHRLRKLLGYDTAVHYHDAKLTLNPELCWVDIWEFERLIGKADANILDDDSRLVILEQALNLYHGVFLATEKTQSWALNMREKLRSKYLRALSIITQNYGRSGMCDQAIALYMKGIEADGLVESFYHQLMLCFAGRGDVARSLETYQKCHHMFQSILGIEPSHEIQALYHALRNGDTYKVEMNCKKCHQYKSPH